LASDLLSNGSPISADGSHPRHRRQRRMLLFGGPRNDLIDYAANRREFNVD
jgi:hypothetical protein